MTQIHIHSLCLARTKQVLLCTRNETDPQIKFLKAIKMLMLQQKSLNRREIVIHLWRQKYYFVIYSNALYPYLNFEANFEANFEKRPCSLFTCEHRCLILCHIFMNSAILNKQMLLAWERVNFS